ncbi:MAG TPA: ankyrin repeat domain-containing protein [Thermoanaerobaculia bacterium]
MDIPATDPRAAALVAAIHAGDVDRLQALLAEDPALPTARIVDDRGAKRTLLHIVADWPGHFPNGPRTTALLIERGADVNAPFGHPGPNPAPETPLHWAASSDDVPVLDALLDGGADIEAPGAVFTGGAPMSDAVVFAQWNAARRLLARGAGTTIWQAAALGLLDRVRDHLAAAPAPTPHDVTNALWHACRGGQREVAELLVSHGADVNWIGHDRKTPLQVARESGAEDLVSWLRN